MVPSRIAFPDEQVLLSLQQCHPDMVQRMAASVRYANSDRPHRWHIAGYEPQPTWIALFVGMYYAISLLPNRYSMILQYDIGAAADRELLERLLVHGAFASPTLARISFGDADVEDVLANFAPAHELAIESVARKGGSRPEPHRPDMWSSLALVSSCLPTPTR